VDIHAPAPKESREYRKFESLAKRLTRVPKDETSEADDKG